MKISYAITVCNEFLEIQKLVPFLLENKRTQDEIVILFDQKNGDPEVLSYLLKFNKLPNVQTWRGFEFDGHFANWKNLLTTYCAGDYIFQIDADEMPNETLLENLPLILEQNPDNEVYLVPRVNTVEGLTQEHIQKWGWNVNEKGWVNWPDYQWRIWKKKPEIKWKNKVHEVLEGFKTYAPLHDTELLALYHPKDIKRQEKQNKYYDSLNYSSLKQEKLNIDNSKLKVSLIIPTNNTNQEYTSALLDNIKTLYGDNPNIEVILEENDKVTLGINYNNAVNKSTGDIVVLLHNDMILKEGFVEKIQRDLKPKTVLSYTRIEPPVYPDTYPGKILLDAGYDLKSFNPEKFNSYKVEDKVIPGGSQLFFAVYKNDYIGIDGYTFTKFCEDDDIHLRYRKAGYKHYVTPAAVYHFGSKTSRIGNYSLIEMESRKKFINKWGYNLEKQNPFKIF